MKKRNQISGQFSALSIEMLESPARQVLSLAARRALDVIEIELAHHGGNDNHKLPITYENFIAYGMDRHSIAPALRELEALGFIRITDHGRAGNAEDRRAGLYGLPYATARGGRQNPPTHDWRKFKTVEEAKKAAQSARAAKDPKAVSRGYRSALRMSKRRMARVEAVMVAPLANGVAID